MEKDFPAIDDKNDWMPNDPINVSLLQEYIDSITA